MAPVWAWAPLCGLLGSKGHKGGRGHERSGLGLGTEVEAGREVEASVLPNQLNTLASYGLFALSFGFCTQSPQITKFPSCGFSVSSEVDGSGREDKSLRLLFTHQVWPRDGRPGRPEPRLGPDTL